MKFQNGFEKIEGYVTTDCPQCSNSYVPFLESGGFFKANLKQFGNKQAGSDLCLNIHSQVSVLEEPTSEERGKIPGDISGMNVTVSCVVTPGSNTRQEREKCATLASSANMPALRTWLCVSYPGSRQALGLCEAADAKVLADKEAVLTEKRWCYFLLL